MIEAIAALVELVAGLTAAIAEAIAGFFGASAESWVGIALALLLLCTFVGVWSCDDVAEESRREIRVELLERGAEFVVERLVDELPDRAPPTTDP